MCIRDREQSAERGAGGGHRHAGSAAARGIRRRAGAPASGGEPVVAGASDQAESGLQAGGDAGGVAPGMSRKFGRTIGIGYCSNSWIPMNSSEAASHESRSESKGSLIQVKDAGGGADTLSEEEKWRAARIIF